MDPLGKTRRHHWKESFKLVKEPGLKVIRLKRVIAPQSCEDLQKLVWWEGGGGRGGGNFIPPLFKRLFKGTLSRGVDEFSLTFPC